MESNHCGWSVTDSENVGSEAIVENEIKVLVFCINGILQDVIGAKIFNASLNSIRINENFNAFLGNYDYVKKKKNGKRHRKVRIFELQM